MNSKRAILVVGVALLAVVFIGQLFSAEDTTTPPRTPGMRGGGSGMMGGGMRGGPEAMGQMTQRYKEMLSLNDEQWKAIEPKLEKVITLSRQSAMGGRRPMMRPQGPGEANRPRPAALPETEVDKARQGLEKVIADKGSNDEIKVKLAALRQAKEKVKLELASAQKDLKAALNVQQEAQLVIAGLLD